MLVCMCARVCMCVRARAYLPHACTHARMRAAGTGSARVASQTLRHTNTLMQTEQRQERGWRTFGGLQGREQDRQERAPRGGGGGLTTLFPAQALRARADPPPLPAPCPVLSPSARLCVRLARWRVWECARPAAAGLQQERVRALIFVPPPGRCLAHHQQRKNPWTINAKAPLLCLPFLCPLHCLPVRCLLLGLAFPPPGPPGSVAQAPSCRSLSPPNFEFRSALPLSVLPMGSHRDEEAHYGAKCLCSCVTGRRWCACAVGSRMRGLRSVLVSCVRRRWCVCACAPAQASRAVPCLRMMCSWPLESRSSPE